MNRQSRATSTRRPFQSDNGYYGQFGGSFVPEILRDSVEQLRSVYAEAIDDPAFQAELDDLRNTYAGRPTPLTEAVNFAARLGGPRIFLKREDLHHTGSHKLNNVLGQCLLARRLGKGRVIAETGAGQHGVATASVAAKLGLEATIYMGRRDLERQFPNVFWMRKLGATVIPVDDGGGVLKDAIDETLRDWASTFDTTHYVLGTACGPHPFPEMVAYFQSVVGTEACWQLDNVIGKPPTSVYACVGGGSNALAIFSGFIDDDGVQLIGVEAGGTGDQLGEHAARIASTNGHVGIAQGYKTMFIQTDDGQLAPTESIAAGLDYVGISPILSNLAEQGRVRFLAARNDDVLKAFSLLAETEGIIPALESSHAIAGLLSEISIYGPQDTVVLNVSGRGDKDIFTVADAFGDVEWQAYLKNRVDAARS